ncbi:hypothetical protein GQX74_005551 [Glossina fuscipes]|nr:hypothetical protein GQX74_005551 [Glossina fuscipes]
MDDNDLVSTLFAIYVELSQCNLGQLKRPIFYVRSHLRTFTRLVYCFYRVDERIVIIVVIIAIVAVFALLLWFAFNKVMQQVEANEVTITLVAQLSTERPADRWIHLATWARKYFEYRFCVNLNFLFKVINKQKHIY